VFVDDLFTKLNQFSELFREKFRGEFKGVNPAGFYQHYGFDSDPTDAELEARAAEVTSAVMPFLGATDTSSFVEAIVAQPTLVERLSDEEINDPTAAGSRIEMALGWIKDGVIDRWEGADRDRFLIYHNSVALAVQRQEALIEALDALAGVYKRMVAQARNDLLGLLDEANAALEDDGGGLGVGLTLLGTAFAIGATLTTGGAAAGLGIASALSGGLASFTDGEGDDFGDGMELGFDDTAMEIHMRTLELIEELKTDVQQKACDIRDAVDRLVDIIYHGGAGIAPNELVPKEPKIYQVYRLEEFKVPDSVPVRP
jgi:hypothetical protein